MLQPIGPRQQECLSRATHCRELAQAATDSRNRAEYLKMEERWLRLADGYQFSERINLFVADKERARKMD
jgi:hypothetical protein